MENEITPQWVLEMRNGSGRPEIPIPDITLTFIRPVKISLDSISGTKNKPGTDILARGGIDQR